MVYGWDFYLNVMFSIGGIIFFIYSLLIIKKIKDILPAGAKVIKRWNIIMILICGFLVGYVLNIIFLTLALGELLTIMTAFVYIFGGLFVFLIISLSFKTYKVIISEEK